jgi:hypothetical protein
MAGALKFAPPEVVEDPVLLRQYEAFTTALATSQNEGFQQMWLQKIAFVIRQAHQKKETSRE